MKMKRLSAAVIAMLMLGAAAASATATLTLEDARDIALEKAQLAVEDVFMTQLNCDEDDGRQVMEVEFVAGGREYEYDIDAETGEIIKESAETLSGRKGGLDASLYLSMQEAMGKALAQAGVAAGQAAFTEIDFDLDDGHAEYDLRFTVDGQIYKVAMDAQTGEVIKYEMKFVNGKK